MASPAKTNNNDNNRREPRPLCVKAKGNIKYNKLESGVSKLTKDGDQCTRVDKVLQPPYEGSKAMLKMNGTWITSNLREHLLHTSHKPTVEKYYNKWFDWQEDIFDMVYWNSVRRVRSKM